MNDIPGLEQVKSYFGKRIEQHGAEELVESLEVVHVGGGGEDGHLLVHLAGDGSGHREHGVQNLFVGHLPRTALGQHGRGQRGEARLVGRVGGRAGQKDHAKTDEGGLGAQRHNLGLGSQRDRPEQQNHHQGDLHFAFSPFSVTTVRP